VEWALFLCEKIGGASNMANITQEFDTIAAISTPPGEGAISIVRLSGEEAIAIADRIFQAGTKTLAQVPSHTIHYGHIVDPEENRLMDEVMLSDEKAADLYPRRCRRDQLPRRDRCRQSTLAAGFTTRRTVG